MLQALELDTKSHALYQHCTIIQNRCFNNATHSLSEYNSNALWEALLRRARWVREQSGSEWHESRGWYDTNSKKCLKNQHIRSKRYLSVTRTLGIRSDCWGNSRSTWEGGALTSWLGILLMREAGGVPVRRIICCSWFISTASKSRGIITWRSACQRAMGWLGWFVYGERMKRKQEGGRQFLRFNKQQHSPDYNL